MEIERKFRIKELPDHIENYDKKVIEQGYLCTNPVVRIRKSNDDYYLTYKSKFGIGDQSLKKACVSNEVEVPLNEESYEHLKEKVDYHLVKKTRYLIPLENNLTAELDVFDGILKGLVFVEVEFKDEESADAFIPPNWFGDDVSLDKRYKNNYLATIEDITQLGL